MGKFLYTLQQQCEHNIVKYIVSTGCYLVDKISPMKFADD